MDNTKFDSTKAEQTLLEAGVSKKLINDYITKYYDKYTLEEYFEFCNCENPKKSIAKFKKYIEEYSDEMDFSEYLLYCDVKKELLNFPILRVYKNELSYFAEASIIDYVKNIDRISFEDYLRYIMPDSEEYSESIINNCFCLVPSHYRFEAYISYLEKGLPISAKQDKSYVKKMINFALEYAKQLVRNNAIIEDGHLKKMLNDEITSICIPEEVIVVDKNAFSCKTLYSILFHDSFERFEDSCVDKLYGVGVYKNNETRTYDEIHDKNELPNSLKYISKSLLDTITGTVYIPNTLENIEEFEDDYDYLIVESEESFDDTAIEIKEFYREELERDPKLKSAVDIFTEAYSDFKNQMHDNDWNDPILAIETCVWCRFSKDSDLIKSEQFIDIIKDMKFVNKYGNSENFKKLALEYVDMVKFGNIKSFLMEGGLCCYELLIAIAVIIVSFIDKDCEIILPFNQSKWEFRGDYSNRKWLCFEISSKSTRAVIEMRKKLSSPSELYSNL